MGSFAGHLLPGVFFLMYGVFCAFKYPYRHVASKQEKRGKGICQCCNLDIFEACAKIVCPAFGILMEQVTNNGPNFHLTNPQHEYWDGNNWSHCTMYLFFLFAGVADILLIKFPTSTPKGINYLAMALALIIEGYLFFFHTHGRSTLEVRIHILLVLAIWTAAGAFVLLWISEAVFTKEDQTNAKECSDQNGTYMSLHSDEYEETVLLDKANDRRDVIESNATIDIDSNLQNGQLSPQLLLLEKRLMANIQQTVNSQQLQKSSLQISLQMIVAAAILLQGTWFVQIAMILYPPGKNGWDETSHINIEFATIFYTWHLAVILAFVIVAYYVISGIIFRRNKKIIPSFK